VVIAALLFGAMKNGPPHAILAQIPVDVISVIQALILLFVQLMRSSALLPGQA